MSRTALRMLVFTNSDCWAHFARQPCRARVSLKGGHTMSTVEVSEKVLSWALDRSNLSADDLASKFPKILEWVSGTARPTLRQLEHLARATRTPLGYFFLSEPPEESLPFPHFRTIDDGIPSQPSPDLIETIHAMQRRQDWMRRSSVERGQEPLPFVRSARTDEHPVTIVESMRHALGLKADWANTYPSWTEALRGLREAMDAAGILIVVNGIVGNSTRRKLCPDEFRGFVLVDEYAPLLFVNGSDSKVAQMFTLAHELAHVFFGSSAAFDLRGMQPAKDPTEKACNRVAAEFLVPESELRRIWPSVRNDPEPHEAVAYQFKVSRLVAARRALDLSLISQDQFFEFYYSHLGEERRESARKESGGDFYRNQNLRVGRRFAVEVANAAAEGQLLYSEAYDLTGPYGNVFHQYVDLVRTDGAY